MRSTIPGVHNLIGSPPELYIEYAIKSGVVTPERESQYWLITDELSRATRLPSLASNFPLTISGDDNKSEIGSERIEVPIAVQ